MEAQHALLTRSALRAAPLTAKIWLKAFSFVRYWMMYWMHAALAHTSLGTRKEL
jgi:hypothetical protein